MLVWVKMQYSRNPRRFYLDYLTIEEFELHSHQLGGMGVESLCRFDDVVKCAIAALTFNLRHELSTLSSAIGKSGVLIRFKHSSFEKIVFHTTERSNVTCFWVHEDEWLKCRRRIAVRHVFHASLQVTL